MSPVLKQPHRGVWRARWRWGCFGCLLSFVVFRWCDRVFVESLRGTKETAFFAIVRGLLALGELSSLTLAGLSAIAWMLSPRARRAAPAINKDLTREQPMP